MNIFLLENIGEQIIRKNIFPGYLTIWLFDHALISVPLRIDTSGGGVNFSALFH